jgi:hypothetical protein
MTDNTKVVTGPNTRFSYAFVWKPKKMEGEREKYSVSLIIPKADTETLSKLEKAIQLAYELGKDKLKGDDGRVPPISAIILPLRDGDVEKRYDRAYDSCYFLTARSEVQPGIVDANLNRITEKTRFYSGCYGRASIHFYAYNHDGKRGIACGLNNLQKLGDGPVLGGRSSPEEDFGDDMLA